MTGAIKAEHRFHDSRGATWRRADDYQESNPHGPGWLVLVSDRGERETFAAVLEFWGHRDRVDGPPYLATTLERSE
jgi:hypothetical protein